jgi:AcrR family transcriptional regulator
LSDMEAREKIVKAVQDMLQEGCEAQDITVRQIAARAGVGIGTVSYHFHSKEKLLFEAVGALMAGLAGWMAPQSSAGEGGGTALERLRGFLLGTAEITLRYSSICSIQLSYELIHGDMSICYFITPLLKEHFGNAKSDLEVKIIALEMITAMQAIFIKMEAFQRYTGLDIRNSAQREEALDIVIDSIIKK